MSPFSIGFSGSGVSSAFNGRGWLVIAVAAAALLPPCTAAAESHGLGDHYDWVSLEEGFQLAKTNSKPLMLIIHKSWCGACKALKPRFSASASILSLSPNFILVNTLDEEEPEGDQYQPDGGYIPRILFYSPDGELLKDIVNEGGNPKYKYYYGDDQQIAESMARVVDIYRGDEDKNKINANTSKVEL